MPFYALYAVMMGWGACLGCTMQQAPTAMRPPPLQASHNAATAQLSPYRLRLPEADREASEAVAAFTGAARRAIDNTYRQDSAELAPLEALAAQLAGDASLQQLRPVWSGMLATTQARAAALSTAAPALRSLRGALRYIYYDAAAGAYRGVDAQQCIVAQTSLAACHGDAATLVHIAPLGVQSIERLLRLCDQSLALQLRERRMPGQRAPAQVARLVARLFARAHLGGKVSGVTWSSNHLGHDGQNQATLEATLGITEAASPHTCSMAAISIILPTRGQKLGAPTLRALGQRRPILCDRIPSTSLIRHAG